jgi:hypothetical protein
MLGGRKNEAFHWVPTLQDSPNKCVCTHSSKTESADPNYYSLSRRNVLPPRAVRPQRQAGHHRRHRQKARRHPTDWATPTTPPGCGSTTCQAVCCGLSRTPSDTAGPHHSLVQSWSWAATQGSARYFRSHVHKTARKSLNGGPWHPH